MATAVTCSAPSAARGSWRPWRALASLPEYSPATIPTAAATTVAIPTAPSNTPPPLKSPPKAKPKKMKIALGELPPAGATAVTMAKTHINLVPPEHKEPIINAAQQQINPYLDLILGPQADHAAAIVHGVLAPYESIIGRNDPAVLKAEVVARVLLAVIAQALLLVGRPKDACVAYGYCAHVFGPAGGDEAEELRQQSHILRPQSVHHREARKVEREIYRFWGDAAMQAGGKADAERVHALGVSYIIYMNYTITYGVYYYHKDP